MVNQIEINLPKLDRHFHGYCIVQISDIHIGTWINRSRLSGIIDLVNEFEPDLVAITGDFVTFDPHRFFKDLSENLMKLSPRDASVAVLGNHDHWTDAGVIREVLHNSSIIDLSNKVITLHRGNTTLHIAGVDDTIEGLDRLDLVQQQIPKDEAAILLVHEPDLADYSAATGKFGLQLSGHSHGGQIQIPFIGPPLLPPHGQKYPSGLYQINGMSLYTNRGVGTAFLQLRWNCPPEISIFTLKS
ncbi:MAG: metallophosphoesterase [Anaerolineales bacterium]|nr:metallophosphoesterase [Anaerolineales bacterium]